VELLHVPLCNLFTYRQQQASIKTVEQNGGENNKNGQN